jgi:hypothetical protein
MVMSSVAAAQGDIFATLGNKIAGTLDIFVEVDHLISGGSSTNSKRFNQQFLSI